MSLTTPHLPQHCHSCRAPLVHLERVGKRFCGRCRSLYGTAGLESLGEASRVLEAILGSTNLERRRVTLSSLGADARCAMAHLGGCNGALQRSHLLAQASFKTHPWLHHADNIAPLCRQHHREYHKAVDGRDFVEYAQRDNAPPGGYGRLTLAYLEFVMTRIPPSLQRAALRVGTILENRTRNRKLRRSVSSESAETLELSLYYRWLYACGLRRIADLAGIVYTYDPKAYVRPSGRAEPGTCRLYRIQPEVLHALRDKSGGEVSDTDISALMAWWLEAHGEGRAAIRELILTARGSKPEKSTLSGWIARGAAWVAEARTPSAVLERGGQARGQGTRGQPRADTPARRTQGEARNEPTRETQNTIRLEGNAVTPHSRVEALGIGSGEAPMDQGENVVAFEVTALLGGVLVVHPALLAQYQAALAASGKGEGASLRVELRFSSA